MKVRNFAFFGVMASILGISGANATTTDTIIASQAYVDAVANAKQDKLQNTHITDNETGQFITDITASNGQITVTRSNALTDLTGAELTANKVVAADAAANISSDTKYPTMAAVNSIVTNAVDAVDVTGFESNVYSAEDDGDLTAVKAIKATIAQDKNNRDDEHMMTDEALNALGGKGKWSDIVPANVKDGNLYDRYVPTIAAVEQRIKGIPATTLSSLGVNASADDLNVLQGANGNVTSSDLTKLGDITASAADINKLDGLTTTATELGYVHGVTSDIQTQLNNRLTAVTAVTDTAGDVPVVKVSQGTDAQVSMEKGRITYTNGIKVQLPNYSTNAEWTTRDCSEENPCVLSLIGLQNNDPEKPIYKWTQMQL